MFPFFLNLWPFEILVSLNVFKQHKKFYADLLLFVPATSYL